MKNFLASAAVLASASQFLCLFCCIVPTATGILALLATLGLTGTNAPMLGDIATAFHPWRMPILGTAVVLISFSWGMWFYNKRRKQKSCEEEVCTPCNTKAAKYPVFLMIATGLLVFNFITVELLH
ncbi:MAG: hypothetical protein LRZ85_01075 [Alphaproteobacteria bacterium]|nr:hypothetical protein [Alphaproteobacteria bacterium]MCD8570614.1 hypothetical protein [Alphaproteobacteria bacterium]